MQKAFRKLFAPPAFPEDEDKTRSAYILNITGWSVIIPDGTYHCSHHFFAWGNSCNQPGPLGIILTTLLSLYVSRLGYVKFASFTLIALGWIGLTYLSWPEYGIRDASFLGYILPILMAGLLLGRNGVIGFTIASIVSGWFLASAETRGLISTASYQPLLFWIDVSGIFVVAGAFISVMINLLQKALNESRATVRELSSSNKELSVLQVDLERRVEERTSELSKRASQLEAVSSVARAIASVQDLDTLLPAITKFISQQFGFYHVGIFLLDEKREHAILRASNSEGGLQMLSRQHSLPLDRHSIVGYSILHGEPRIALDVGVDAVYFNNPDLPETRSRWRSPRVSGQVIGSLDVHIQTNDSQEDISVLTTLADQVAIAIENARLFGEARTALMNPDLI
jgi:hypothetical protein